MGRAFDPHGFNFRTGLNSGFDEVVSQEQLSSYAHSITLEIADPLVSPQYQQCPRIL